MSGDRAAPWGAGVPAVVGIGEPGPVGDAVKGKGGVNGIGGGGGGVYVRAGVIRQKGIL